MSDDDACPGMPEGVTDCESGSAYVYFLPEPAEWLLYVTALATFALYSYLRRPRAA
jgi:hypothetical protein